MRLDRGPARRLDLDNRVDTPDWASSKRSSTIVAVIRLLQALIITSSLRGEVERFEYRFIGGYDDVGFVYLNFSFSLLTEDP